MLYTFLHNESIRPEHDSCKKSQKGVYLHCEKSQKGVEYGSSKISKRCKRYSFEAQEISATSCLLIAVDESKYSSYFCSKKK